MVFINVEKTSKLNFATAFPHAGHMNIQDKRNSKVLNKRNDYIHTKEYRLRVYVANNTDKSTYINL